MFFELNSISIKFNTEVINKKVIEFQNIFFLLNANLNLNIYI